MIGTGKSRLNYYEMLGISPSAATDAITRAFSKATNVLRPHVFGGITELCVAYETLRDPTRRRAYDASIGVVPKPSLPLVSRPASAHFMVRPTAAAAPPSPPPKVPETPPPVGRVDPRPVRLDVSPLPTASPYTTNDGINPIKWKRTGALMGGLVAAAVLVGGIGGWWSLSETANPGPSASAEPAELAPKRQAASSSWERPEPTLYKAVEGIEPQRRAVRAQPRARPVDRRTQLAASQAETELSQPPPDMADQPAGDPLAPESTPASMVNAAIPLPHKTVARTIDRIGYSCGKVTSAMPVEGEAGVFTITCASGQSFQARQVRGRYRFKRIAKD